MPVNDYYQNASNILERIDAELARDYRLASVDYFSQTVASTLGISEEEFKKLSAMDEDWHLVDLREHIAHKSKPTTQVLSNAEYAVPGGLQPPRHFMTTATTATIPTAFASQRYAVTYATT
jgi:hypothetical protein